ncbi:MAG: PEP-CTERM sorting domain-containing protein [Fimbriimonadaceae bacterium]|nr:PEP-CTERM sorting domain-containing protein [Fimbriimonadaceae bacterium]
MKRLLVLGLLTTLSLSNALAVGVFIPGNRKLGDVPSNPGDGLCGFYWDAGPYYTNEDALAFSNANTAQGEFVSTNVDYSNGMEDVVPDETLLTNFLGFDAGTLTGGVGSNVLETSVFRFQGGIAIRPEYDLDLAAPGITVRFDLGSDDGSGMNVADITVIENGGDHGFGFQGNFATFEDPGLYPVDLVYYENFGVTGVEWYSSITGGPDSGRPDGGSVGIVPTSSLYCLVPEPATFAALGLGALTLMRRRRK